MERGQSFPFDLVYSEAEAPRKGETARQTAGSGGSCGEHHDFAARQRQASRYSHETDSVWLTCKDPMRAFAPFLCAALLAVTPMASARAQSVPPLETFKQMAAASATQWVAFRNFSGRQLVYFSAVVSYACGLSEIRWSLNTDALDKTWPLDQCNEYLPFSIGEKTKIYEAFKLDTAKTISVQLVFKDGTATDTLTYAPCPGVGEATCARRVEASAVVAKQPETCVAPCAVGGAAGSGGASSEVGR